MYQFFVEPSQISEKSILINGADVNHIKNVLRLRVGENISISDGQGETFYCIIDLISDNTIVANIIDRRKSSKELKTKIFLFQGLPKKDKFELIIQKAVELGVYEIIPVITARTIVKLDDKKELKKSNRWDSIAESAAKQAGRDIIPKVKAPMKYKEALEYARSLEKNIIPYEMATNVMHSKQVISNMQCSSVGVFIGPEGGFEEGEVKMAVDNNIVPITLGKRILRTETAGITVMSLLMFSIEED
ncbi:MAG: methyltransferase, RsmE family [Clostridiales bacterium]|jgi:16S rRNA (uracil1498-N3)-methyltransferase|nr:methyltransferase, RsmE family [Clostridiales bacterium]